MGQYLLVSPSYPYIWPLLPSRQVSIIYLFPTPAHSIFFLRPVENAPTNNNIASQQAIEAKFRSQPESSSEVILHLLFLCIQIKWHFFLSFILPYRTSFLVRKRKTLFVSLPDAAKPAAFIMTEGRLLVPNRASGGLGRTWD